MTRGELALMAGVSEQYIAEIEDEELLPSREVLGELERSLNMNGEIFLYGINYESMEMAIWTAKKENDRLYDPEVVLRRPLKELL